MILFIQSYLGLTDSTFLVELTACLLLISFVTIVLSTLFGVIQAIFRFRR